MKNKIFIFDLDDTVVDSSHRATLDSNLNLDLDAWRRDSTYENIMNDKLLPLAGFMNDCIKSDNAYVWVCTARNMQQADHDFLAKWDLTPNLVLSRQLDDDTADDLLKRKMIRKMLNLKPFRDCEVIFFDDKPKNLKALEDVVDYSLHAPSINQAKSVPMYWENS